MTTLQMTQDEYQRLEAELEELEGEGRRQMAEAIAHARSFGNLEENTEYQLALDDQAELERRIAQIRDRLQVAEIVEPVGRVAGIGSLVEIADAHGERSRFRLSNVSGVERGVHNVSPSSPLGRALLGAKAGQEVEVAAPRGSWTATVVSVRAAK